MSVVVSWGRKFPRYDKRRRNYNSDINRWNRYSENLKRGYVLKFYSEYDEQKLLNLEFTGGLVELENMRLWGFRVLRKVSCVDRLIKQMREIYGEEYHRWGIEGDNWTRGNNPFRQVVNVKS